MDSPTDSQLAQSILKKLNRLTIYLILSMVLLFVMGREEGIFGLKANKTLQDLLSFDLSNPLRIFGLTTISSFFIHASLKHLLSNIFWLVLIGMFIENSQGKKPLIILLCAGHWLGLAICFLLFQGKVVGLDSSSLVLGSSAGIVCLIGYSALFMRRVLGYSICLVLTFAILWPVLQHGKPAIETLNHIIPLFGGWILGVLSKKRFVARQLR